MVAVSWSNIAAGGSSLQRRIACRFSRRRTRCHMHESGPIRICSVRSAATSAVWAECLFADPIADIAVLDSPDNQELFEQAEAYEALVDSTKPLTIANAPKMGRKRVRDFEVDTPGARFRVPVIARRRMGPV